MTQVVFAAGVLLVALVYGAMALAMPRGSLAYPGPGFFPVMVGGFLVVAAAACLVQALAPGRRAGGAATPAPPAPDAWRVGKPALLLGLLLAYGVLLKPLGFPGAIFLFVLAAMRAFGYRRWLVASGIACALTIVSYVTFVLWLKVPLPMGAVGEWLE